MRLIPMLVIRTDASVNIGSGHVMRMIALGLEWQERGGEVIFVCAEITPALKKRIAKEGFRLESIDAEPGSQQDLEKTCSKINALNNPKNCSVALDGYRFGSDFQLGLKKAGFHFLVMDDYGHAEFNHADWVLNQNISANENLYGYRSKDTKLLLGTDYALLRNEFLQYRGWKRDIPEVAKKVLLTLGGADPHNITKEVIGVLAGMDLEVKVVVGGSNPHLESLYRSVKLLPLGLPKVEFVINTDKMPELMAWADMAVAAGGSTAWELAFMSVPSIYLILADNQKEISLSLEREEMGLSFDPGIEDMGTQLPSIIRMLISDQSLREQFSVNASKAVDGFGAARVCDLLI